MVEDGIPKSDLQEALNEVERRREFRWSSIEYEEIEVDEYQVVFVLPSSTSDCFHRVDNCPMLKHADTDPDDKTYCEVENWRDKCGHCWKQSKDL